MAGEKYDDVVFKMVDGDTFTMRRVAGLGVNALNDSYESTWITIDGETRIRADNVVSIKLNAHGAARRRFTRVDLPAGAGGKPDATTSC